MSRIIKTAAVIGAIASLVMVFTPAFFDVSHTQALASVLFGQFATMAIGHTAYRVTSGKRPDMRAAIAGVICGAGLAVSPILLGLVSGFTTLTMVGGGIIAAVGLYGIVANLTGEDEQRIPDIRTEQSPEDSAKTA